MPESLAPETDSQPESRCVLVCQYHSCLKNGSAAVLAAFEAQQVAGVKVEAVVVRDSAPLARLYELPQRKFGIVELNRVMYR